MLTRDITSPIARTISQAIDAFPSKSSPAPLPDPTTVSFTSAQVIPGFTGPISTTKNAARVYLRADITLWSGWITGTEAKITLTSEYGDFDGAVQVAIDSGSFSNAPRSGQVFTLFTGLSHAKRFVEFRIADGLGDVAYISSSGNVLSVIGQPPSIQVLNNKIQVGADSSTGLYSGAFFPNPDTSFLPSIQAPKGTTYGSNVGSVKIKGAFTKLVVTLNGTRKVGVSKNGGNPSYYSIADEDSLPARALVIPCDGSISVYNVWDDGNFRPTGGNFSVAGDSTFLDIGTRRRLDQDGDSATFGSGPGASSYNTETMAVASALGFVGSTNGISGLTIAGCKTMLDAVLPLRTVSSNDVAVLAIGGNNAASGIDATAQADYGSCIDKLLAKGYGKILCRGILPIAAAQGQIDAANTLLKAVVTAKANPNIVWIETVTWTGYETQDGVHPTANGYATLAGYAISAYRAALGL